MRSATALQMNAICHKSKTLRRMVTPHYYTTCCNLYIHYGCCATLRTLTAMTMVRQAPRESNGHGTDGHAAKAERKGRHAEHGTLCAAIATERPLSKSTGQLRVVMASLTAPHGTPVIHFWLVEMDAQPWLRVSGLGQDPDSRVGTYGSCTPPAAVTRH